MPVKRIESESQDHQSENDTDRQAWKWFFQFVKIINKLLQIVLSTFIYVKNYFEKCLKMIMFSSMIRDVQKIILNFRKKKNTFSTKESHDHSWHLFTYISIYK